MYTKKQLDHTIALLEQLLQFDRPADAIVSPYLRANRDLGSNDRAQIAETVFACLRHLEQLHSLLGPKANSRSLVLTTLIRIQRKHVTEFERVLKSGENKWLASIKNMALSNSTIVQAGLPQWIIDKLTVEQSIGDIIRMGRAMMEPAPMDIRVNTLKNKKHNIAQILQDSGIECEETPYSPVGLRLVGHPAINRHPAYIAGEIEVQDEGSQLMSILLGAKRGEMIVDFCAGAGGKTLHIGAMMASTGRLYAFDVSAKRLARFKPRLARSGLSNVNSQVINHENDTHIKRLAGKIDRILIDAPCSGLGTLRRNPDLKYRQMPPSIERLNTLQAAILDSASKMLKQGGTLVYGTCSILPQENQQIIESFLNKHPEFSIIPANNILRDRHISLDTGDFLQLRPHIHHTDGFFAAVLKKEA